jgi:hypothetical protein
VGQAGAGTAARRAHFLDLGAVLLTLALSAVSAAAATRPAGEQEKIDWLLDQIRTSDATFIRNGTEYTGEKAASYIKQKLRFGGKSVQTARDFIMRVASKSEHSGKPYEIRPKGAMASTPLGDWLVAKLEEYEKAAEARAKATPPPRK